jgi:hypothetical protein
LELIETHEQRVPMGAWLIEQETIGETETCCKSYSGINSISSTTVGNWLAHGCTCAEEKSGAGDRDRTGDIQLGKLAFYR